MIGALLLCHFGSARAQATTWWPDPATGLMWTGNELDYKHAHKFTQAEPMCGALTLGGYTGWRLPTLPEVNATLGTTTLYAVIPDDPVLKEPPTFHRLPPGPPTLDPNNTSTGSTLKFNGFRRAALFTSTPAAAGKMYFKTWDSPQSSAAYPATTKIMYAAIFCVRTMEPDLRELARSSHPPTAVHDTAEMQAIAVMVQAEAAIDADSFADGTSLAARAVAAEPKAARALNDLGLAQAYSGQPAKAMATLQQAHKADKYNEDVKANLLWVRIFQKQLPADPKAQQAWVLVHDATVARTAKNYDAATAACNKLIALEPTWPQGYEELGRTLQAQNNLPDAVAAYTRSVALDQHKQTRSSLELKFAKQDIHQRKVVSN